MEFSRYDIVELAFRLVYGCFPIGPIVFCYQLGENNELRSLVIFALESETIPERVVVQQFVDAGEPRDFVFEQIAQMNP